VGQGRRSCFPTLLASSECSDLAWLRDMTNDTVHTRSTIHINI
jgi:hypothetical protein